MRVIGIGASGLRGQQYAIEVIGHNIANVSTPGFKAEKAGFAEAFQASLSVTQTENGVPAGSPTVGAGAGVRLSKIGCNFQQGILTPTDNPFDLAIEGSGFFQVETPNGQTAYTRAGSFQLDGEANLVDAQGNRVIIDGDLSGIEEALNVGVTPNGTIIGTVDGEQVEFGRIELAMFTQPQGLAKIGGNLYLESANSGEPIIGEPQTDSFGTIHSNMLESSNVDIASTMTDIIQAQRAYEMNSKVVQAGDEMWSIANSLRR